MFSHKYIWCHKEIKIIGMTTLKRKRQSCQLGSRVKNNVYSCGEDKVVSSLWKTQCGGSKTKLELLSGPIAPLEMKHAVK